MRHIYTIHGRDGEVMRAQVQANNSRQALREFGKRTCRDQRVPLHEFVKGYEARYLCKQDGTMPVYCH